MCFEDDATHASHALEHSCAHAFEKVVLKLVEITFRAVSSS